MLVIVICALALIAFAWLLFRCSPGKAPSKTFVEWCREKTTPPDHSFDLISFEKHCRSQNVDWSAQQEKEFFDEISNQLQAEKSVSVVLNRHISAQAYRIEGLGRGYKGCLVLLETGGNPVGGTLTLEGVTARRITLTTSRIHVDIKSCDIASLFVGHRCDVSLTLQDSNIGTLELEDGQCVAYFDMRDGSILNIVCEPAGQANPFTGPVSLREVFLPRASINDFLKGPQPYRNLRSHFLSLGNVQAASLVNAAELAVEREEEGSQTLKAMSVLYQVFSDFGLSAFRPIAWLFALFLVSAVVTFTYDGAVLVDKSPPGWYSILEEQGWTGRIAQAIVMAWQPVTNPLGIRGSGTLLVPDYPLLAIWLEIQSVLSLTLIALFVFALRRRLKMQ